MLGWLSEGRVGLWQGGIDISYAHLAKDALYGDAGDKQLWGGANNYKLFGSDEGLSPDNLEPS